MKLPLSKETASNRQSKTKASTMPSLTGLSSGSDDYFLRNMTQPAESMRQYRQEQRELAAAADPATAYNPPQPPPSGPLQPGWRSSCKPTTDQPTGNCVTILLTNLTHIATHGRLRSHIGQKALLQQVGLLPVTGRPQQFHHGFRRAETGLLLVFAQVVARPGNRP